MCLYPCLATDFKVSVISPVRWINMGLINIIYEGSYFDAYISIAVNLDYPYCSYPRPHCCQEGGMHMRNLGLLILNNIKVTFEKRKYYHIRLSALVGAVFDDNTQFIECQYPEARFH